MQIRALLPADLPACQAIVTELSDYFTPDVPAKLAALPPRTSSLLAESEGQVLGFICVEHRSAHAAEVLWAAVRRADQRVGIGSALLEAAFEELRAEGVELVEVKTLDASAGYEPYVATRAFWERHGFLQIDAIDPLPDWPPGNPAAIYVRGLPADDGVPRVPASAGATIFDPDGRLLILKPTYKAGWTIPGGAIDATGESPWAACRREVAEETGLDVVRGELAAVDFRPARSGRAGGVRFLFDCGTLGHDELAAVVLQPEEIEDHRLAEPEAALALLSGPIRRRVGAALRRQGCVYLEDGRPLDDVGPSR